MNIKEIRRHNLRELAKSIGGVCRLADRMGRSQPQMSHLVSPKPRKNIGDKLAAVIEQMFDKPSGWLDKEHDADLNTALDTQVPLIPWIEVKEPLAVGSNVLEKGHLLVPIKIAYSKKAYALQIDRDDMQCAKSISFPLGSIIIVDPEYPYKNGSFVIASIHNQEWVMFRQLTMVGDTYCFNALNEKYRTIKVLQEFIKIHGVVRYMFMELV